jgi:hypothetical protein
LLCNFSEEILRWNGLKSAGTLVLLFVGDAPLVLLVSACICRLLGRKSLPSGTSVYRIYRLESVMRIGYATWIIRNAEPLLFFFPESDLSAFGRQFYLIDTVSTVRENFHFCSSANILILASDSRRPFGL